MPVRRHASRPRPVRPEAPRCSWEGCRRAGEGLPPLCTLHAEEAADEYSQFEESVDVVIENVMEHPQVQQLARRATGVFDQITSFLEQLKRGDFPKRPPAQATPRPEAVADANKLARAIMHFAPIEPLTEARIRERKHALARMVHPDAGGSIAEMQRINWAAAELMKTSVKP